MKKRTYTYDMISDRMKSKLLSLYEVDSTTQCWNWTGRSGHHGYGFMSGCNKSMANLVVHRLSWMLHNQQDWPVDLETRHLCHNRRCINPAHLVPGTREENLDDLRKQNKIRISQMNANGLELVTPKGVFASIAQASKAHDVCNQMMYRYIKSDPTNFYRKKR
jgi:hypothetical protein